MSNSRNNAKQQFSSWLVHQRWGSLSNRLRDGMNATEIRDFTEMFIELNKPNLWDGLSIVLETHFSKSMSHHKNNKTQLEYIFSQMLLPIAKSSDISLRKNISQLAEKLNSSLIFESDLEDKNAGFFHTAAMRDWENSNIARTVNIFPILIVCDCFEYWESSSAVLFSKATSYMRDNFESMVNACTSRDPKWINSLKTLYKSHKLPDEKWRQYLLLAGNIDSLKLEHCSYPVSRTIIDFIESKKYQHPQESVLLDTFLKRSTNIEQWLQHDESADAQIMRAIVERTEIIGDQCAEAAIASIARSLDMPYSSILKRIDSILTVEPHTHVIDYSFDT